MRKILQKLVTYGCSAHFLNLVEKEVTPKSMRHIVEVHKYFSNHHQAHVSNKLINYNCT